MEVVSFSSGNCTKYDTVDRESRGDPLIPQATDAEIWLLRQKEQSSLSMMWPFEKAGPRRPKLGDDPSDRGLANTATG